MRTEIHALTIQGGAVHYAAVLAPTLAANVEEELRTLEQVEEAEHLYTIDWSAIDVATHDANHPFMTLEHLEPVHQVWHRVTDAALKCMQVHDGLQETPGFLEDAHEAPEFIFRRLDERRPRRRPQGDRFSVRPFHSRELRDLMAAGLEDLEHPRSWYAGHLDIKAAYDEAAVERDVGPDHVRSREVDCYVRELQIAFACSATIQHRLNSPIISSTS